MSTDTRSKTRAVAVYPNGTRCVIRRRSGVYWYTSTAGSSHMRDAIAAVEAEGGTVVREPNPHYRPTQRDPFAAILRGFGI